MFSKGYTEDPHSHLAEARKHNWLAKCSQGFIVLDQQGVVDINQADDDMRTPLRDVIFPKGTSITLPHLFVGRDPNFHEDPETFNPDRSEFTHRQFGKGAHIGLGMFLAKADAEEAFKAIVGRCLRDCSAAGCCGRRAGAVR